MLFESRIAMYIGAFVLCQVLCHFGQTRFLMAHPNERSAHTRPTSTFGGMAIWISMLCVMGFDLMLAVFYGKGSGLSFSANHWTLFALSSILALSGVVDDYRHISPYIRFFIQSIFSVLGILCVLNIKCADYNAMFYAVHFVLILAFINAGNFSDSLNGLLSGTVLVWCCYVMILSKPDPFLILFACIILSFFVLNFFKGSIFLGDSGSTFLSGMCVLYGFDVLSGGMCFETGFLHLRELTLFFAPFIFVFFDVVATLLNRIRQGHSPFTPHKEHLNQLLHHHGKMSHQLITLIYMMGSISITVFQMMIISHELIFIVGNIVLLCCLTGIWVRVRRYVLGDIQN